jgi:hypothetical protein
MRIMMIMMRRWNSFEREKKLMMELEINFDGKEYSYYNVFLFHLFYFSIGYCFVFVF